LAKKRRKPEPSPKERRLPAGRVVVVMLLAAVLAGTALVVDTEAAAAFDAPKRLLAMLGIALAAAATLVFDAPPLRLAAPAGPPVRRAALVLAGAALILSLVAAGLSPRRALSMDAMRTVALFAVLLPLGASRPVARGKTWLAGVFLAATAVNAAVSLLESRGLFHPFPLETFGDRQETGAYAGNVGYLAITLAFGAVLSLGVVLTSRRTWARAGAGVSLALFGLALLMNRNITALTSTLAGAGLLLVLLYRRRAALPMAAALVVAAVGIAAYSPLRHRLDEAAGAARHGNWDVLVSFRGGAWAAALEMTRERPLTGYGPGTYGAEYVPHRLSAEIRARQRFVAPLMTSSYAEAHCDYLQVFSDAGVPAGLAVLGAAGCLFAAVGRAARRGGGPEAVILLAILAAGATAALTWFPLQRPVTAVPLLLAAGRAWKISAGEDPAPAEAAS
jgi:O-antigen ligase